MRGHTSSPLPPIVAVFCLQFYKLPSAGRSFCLPMTTPSLLISPKASYSYNISSNYQLLHSHHCLVPSLHSFWVCGRHKDQISSPRRSIRIICRRAGDQIVIPAGLPERFPQNQSLPAVLPKKKKRPYVIPRRKLSKKEKERAEQLRLSPPRNGMLVEELISVAHNVMAARSTLYEGVRELMKVLPVHACDFCSEICVGQHGHQIRSCQGPQCNSRNGHHLWVKANIDDILVPVESFHLFDRLAKKIKHEQRFKIDRLPAVVELCIQAGVDIPEYPTLRRTEPIESPTEDEEFAKDKCSINKSLQLIMSNDSHSPSKEGRSIVLSSECDHNDLKGDLEKEDQDDQRDNTKSIEVPNVEENMQVIANRTLQAWSRMRKGVHMLMKKYPVRACGYCPEVHVGPCGHGARVCGEFKHQWRNGQHGWQEAALDDIIPPKFVWHVRDKDGPPLSNALRKFYGQAPAVVELCVQGGADVPALWKPMMRLDVVIPALEEVEAVA